MLLISMCAILTSLGPAFSQGMTLAGTGYSDPSIIRVAPGQITTLFVTGLKTVLSSPQTATRLPLPTTLGGIAVTLNQSGQQSSVPLLSVQQMSVCGNGGAPPPASGLTADCFITAITVQIPFELVLPGGDKTFGVTELAVSENGNISKSFRILPITDNLHVLTTCDVFPSPHLISVSDPIPSAAPFCVALVTHGGGTLVTANDPAKPGEEIVIWAFGLGPTSPAVKTGAATPAPAPALANGTAIVQFDFRPNAGPARPYINPLIMAPFFPGAIFAGLTPGEVGLYQINVRIPETVPPLTSCTTAVTVTGSGVGSLLGFVTSNLTIDIGAVTSFDGAAICVQPGQ
jgi:hypothetical protein